MSWFFRISATDIAEFLADHTEGVWVQHNLVPGPGGIPEYVMEYTAGYELRKATLKWSRESPSGVAQDDAMCTFHLLNVTDGAPDDSWTPTDYAGAESIFLALWDSLHYLYPTSVILHEIEWRADGPDFKPFGSSLAPTLRITPLTLDGSDSTHEQRLPPQTAMSVTERTDAHFTAYGVGVPGRTPGTGRTQVRNRWGRFYLPAPQAYYLDNVGRWRTDIIADVCTSVQQAYNELKSNGFFPVVYSPTTGHAYDVTEVAVDDITDVIRSRRYTTVESRAVMAIDD